jgi:glycosyltransferase involved in cell wall biosynthesis
MDSQRASISNPDSKQELTEHFLQLCTVDNAHARASGYDVVGEYMTECRLLRMPRQSHYRLRDRIIGKVIRQFSVSNWYYRSSWALESEGLRLSRQRAFNLVHYLWGERDLGFPRSWPEKTKKIATFHLPNSLHGSVIRRPQYLQALDAIVLMSESQMPFFLNAGVPRHRLKVILHGVDTNYFRPKGYANRDQQIIRVLSVGNYLRDFKLLSEICRAAVGSNIQFRIVGSKFNSHWFERLPNVTYESGLLDADLLAAYHAADLFLMIVEDSTANNAIMEAMSCGLPIVSQRIGGIPEYVTQGSGFCLDSNEPDAYVDEILNLGSNEATLIRFGAAARTRAEQLSWTQVAEMTRALYSDVLNEN